MQHFGSAGEITSCHVKQYKYSKDGVDLLNAQAQAKQHRRSKVDQKGQLAEASALNKGDKKGSRRA